MVTNVTSFHLALNFVWRQLIVVSEKVLTVQFKTYDLTKILILSYLWMYARFLIDINLCEIGFNISI